MAKVARFLSAALLASALSSAQADGAPALNILPWSPLAVANNGMASGDHVSADKGFWWTSSTGVAYLPSAVSGYNDGGSTTLINSGSGTTIVSMSFNPGTGLYAPTLYSASTGQITGYLPGMAGVTTAAGYVSSSKVGAISSNGSYVVGYSYNGNGDRFYGGNASIWNVSTGALTDLGGSGQAGIYAFARADGVSNDGRVVAGRNLAYTPLVWTDFDGDGSYTRIDLNVHKGVDFGAAEGVSANGQWVFGDTRNSTIKQGAYRYNPSTDVLQPLGQLVNNNLPSYATSANADGSMIVGFQEGAIITQRVGFIWREGMGIQSFDSYVSGFGVDPTNVFNFAVVSGMSADGLSFVGYGNMVGSTTLVGFELTLPAAAVPEPSSYAMLLAGLGVMGFIARRRKA